MKHLYINLSPEIENHFDVDVDLMSNVAEIKKDGRIIKTITIMRNEDGFHYEYGKNFVVIKKSIDGSFGGIESTGKFKPRTIEEKELLIKWAILEKMQLLLNKNKPKPDESKLLPTRRVTRNTPANSSTDREWTHLRNTNGNHYKFWKCRVVDNTHERIWGRIGTNGRSHTFIFSSIHEAQKKFDDLVRSKLRDGYARV